MVIKPPTNKRQLRCFIGMIIYYKDMFAQRAHMMKSLTSIVGKQSQWIWEEDQQRAFDQLKTTLKKLL